RRRDGAVEGAHVQENLSGKTHEVRARCTVAAVGPWALQVAGCNPGPLRFSKGVHLVLPPLPGPSDRAVLLTARSDRRVFFLIPWYGATLVGTTDTDYHGDIDQARVEDSDRDYLLSEVHHRCPGLGWTPADVRGAYVGVRTLQGSSGHIGAATREWTLAEPHAGLLVPVGGKLTSARVEAAHTVDRCLALLGQRLRPSVTGQRRLPWAPADPWLDWSAGQTAIGTGLGLDPSTAATCVRRHGTHVERLWTRLRNHPHDTHRIDPRYPFCRGEMAHALTHEMALTPQDVLRRRLPLTILGVAAGALVPQVEALITAVPGNPTHRSR
ncbi:MAG TPA: glycerol-3-phosphate dehydrogenase C-terminal domain-containing protein, partial [Planctomycetota bacterium]|nr:glycerol-3-phosphate dehydrogenase C-terminal domain-containing protein [Planctomycetota bacterium]